MAHETDVSTTVDITNYQLVSITGSGMVSVMNPPRAPMTPMSALVFAAWLVAIASMDVPEGAFESILDRVRNT